MGSNTSQKLLEATVFRLSLPNLPGAAKINQHLHGNLSSWYERGEDEGRGRKVGKEERKRKEEERRRVSSLNSLFKSYQDLRTYH